MSPEGVVFGSGSSSGLDGNDGYEVRQPTKAEFEHWRETGRFTDDPREVSFNMSSAAAAAMGRNDVSTKDDPSWLDVIGPFQQNYPGVAPRPFHPKKSGYHEMARAIQYEVKMSLDSDQLPTNNPPPLSGSNPKHSIQILVRGTGSKQLSWVAFLGPQGVAVNPCGDTHLWAFAAETFSEEDLKGSTDIDHPPQISAGHKWPVHIEGEHDCRYDSTNGAGELLCGDYLAYPFADDPGKGEATMNYSGSSYDIHTGYWHRSYSWSTRASIRDLEGSYISVSLFSSVLFK
jgi:hypothetical protein